MCALVSVLYMAAELQMFAQMCCSAYRTRGVISQAGFPAGWRRNVRNPQSLNRNLYVIALARWDCDSQLQISFRSGKNISYFNSFLLLGLGWSLQGQPSWIICFHPTLPCILFFRIHIHLDNFTMTKFTRLSFHALGVLGQPCLDDCVTSPKAGAALPSYHFPLILSWSVEREFRVGSGLFAG